MITLYLNKYNIFYKIFNTNSLFFLNFSFKKKPKNNYQNLISK